MLVALQILAVLVVAVAMSLALAHALELPGKMRLTKEQYLAIQQIYYPGFTFGGLAEPLGLLLLAILMFMMPGQSTAAWLTAGAFAALIAMHTTYWLLTHPVNGFWLKGFELTRLGARFFALGQPLRGEPPRRPEWTALRDRWEYSHVVRALLGIVSLILLVAAVAV